MAEAATAIMVWEAQAVGEEPLPAALHSWPMQSCHGSRCWCIMCEGSCWEEKKNQASSMGGSLAYACLKQKIRAASAQNASEHLSCSAPPQHSWGCHCHPRHRDSRGCSRPAHPPRSAAERLPWAGPPPFWYGPSVIVLARLRMLIISDMCLKRSSTFSQGCSVPAAHLGYEIAALSPWGLCLAAINEQ